jgi:hypothetical protein
LKMVHTFSMVPGDKSNYYIKPCTVNCVMLLAHSVTQPKVQRGSPLNFKPRSFISNKETLARDPSISLESSVYSTVHAVELEKVIKLR